MTMVYLHALGDLFIYPSTIRFEKSLLLKGLLPSKGRVKLNMDGYSFGNPGNSDFGGSLRDYKGQLLFSFTYNLGVNSNTFVEVSVLFIVLDLCYPFGYTNVKIESDSELIVKWLKNEEQIPIKYQLICLEFWGG